MVFLFSVQVHFLKEGLVRFLQWGDGVYTYLLQIHLPFGFKCVCRFQWLKNLAVHWTHYAGFMTFPRCSGLVVWVVNGTGKLWQGPCYISNMMQFSVTQCLMSYPVSLVGRCLFTQCVSVICCMLCSILHMGG